ncbi:hypothetical protein THZG08_70139 [Vibrio owensii]|nr:hypothetical protein THZG08_70139 [Vibrio owensii]
MQRRSYGKEGRDKELNLGIGHTKNRTLKGAVLVKSNVTE